MASNRSKESLYKEENATSEDGLLEGQDDLDSVEFRHASHLRQKGRKKFGSFRILIFSHVVALLLYAAIFFAASRYYAQKFAHGPDLIYCTLEFGMWKFDLGLKDSDFSPGPRGCSI